MTKVTTDKIEQYRVMCEAWLKTNPKLTCSDIKSGKDAWNVATHCGVRADAYKDPLLVDAHLQPVLQKIFPNAVFIERMTG